MNNTFSVSEVFKQGWEYTKKYITFLIISTLVYFVVNSILNNLDKQGIGSFILGIASLIVSFVFTIGMLKIALLVQRGGVPRAGDFKTDIKTFLKVLWADIIVWFFALIGFILLIVPGIIVVVRLSLTNWLIVDKNMSSWEAIKESWRLTKGFGWQIFIFGISALIIIIIAAIPFGLGLLVAVPFIIFSYAIVYKKIIGEDVATSTVPIELPPESTEKESANTVPPEPQADTTVSTIVTPPPLITETKEEKAPETPENKKEVSEDSPIQ